MSDTSTGTITSIRLRQDQSMDSDTSSVTSLPYAVKVPPPYPGQSNKKPVRETDAHRNQANHPGAQSPSPMDRMKHRIHMLEVENRRLMSSQAQLVADTNKRVEMQMTDMNALREELKRVQHSNKELRDVCAFLDDDRRKIRQLSNEWHKFGRYTTGVMQQEVRAYQNKFREMEGRQKFLEVENEELKRLCLYLDEQRQALIRERDSICANSSRLPVIAGGSTASVTCDSSGCGSAASPATSQDGDDSAGISNINEPSNSTYDQKQERTLQMITQQMQTSICETHVSDTDQSCGGSVPPNERMLEYMQSLENRIRHLELNHHHSPESYLRPNTNILSEVDERTVLERDYPNRVSDDSMQSLELDDVTYNSAISSVKRISPAVVNTDAMLESTSTMTSSGTTYCSSMTDESADRAVLVMGDEGDMDGVSLLEVRTLGPIDEEAEEDLSSSTRHASRSSDHSKSDQVGKDKMKSDFGRDRIKEDMRQDRTRDFGQGRTKETIGEDRREDIERDGSEEPIDTGDQTADNSLASTALNDSEEHSKEEEISDGSYIEMPPPIEPVSDSVSRLSLCSSDISSEGMTPSRHTADYGIVSPNSIANIGGADMSPERIGEDYDSVNGRDSLAEAVEVLRVHEMAARRSMRGLSKHETAIVHHMCQMAWDSLDRKSHTLSNADSQDRSAKPHMTTV